MLVIRLSRVGRKNAATFRLIVQEKTQAPKSKAHEIVGSYNPHLKDRKTQVQLKTERISYWLSKGAQPSATVHNMLVEFGVIQGKKQKVVGSKKGADAERKAAARAAKATAPAKDAAAATETPSTEPTAPEQPAA